MTRPCSSAALGVALAAALLTCASAPPSSAQEPGSTTRASPSLEDLGLSGFAQTAGNPRVHGTMVAVSVRLPVGSAEDPEGGEGTAWLLARVRAAQAARRLDPADAVLTSRVERSHTMYTLLATPDTWRAAWQEVGDLLYGAPLPGADFERHRAELLERLSFEAGSPARQFQGESAGMLADPGSPWVRPPRGTPASVGGLTLADLEEYGRQHYLRHASAVAVVGPGADVPVDSASVPPPRRGPAWLEGTRSTLVREVTSTWLSVAYPAPSGLGRTALELVAHVLKEELDPVPPAPGRYNIDVRLEEAPGGTILVVEASVLPEAADEWEDRVIQTVQRLAEEPGNDDFFRWQRRRFRATLLLGEAHPEAEAERITADLLRTGVPRPMGVEIWNLNARALQLAAGALGPPRILRSGPDLGVASGARD